MNVPDLAEPQSCKAPIITLSDLYSEVARRTDTDGTHINVAETSRVCAKLFEVLEEQRGHDVLRLVHMGLCKHQS